MRIYGHSMAPTLNPGDIVFVSKRSFTDRSPRKGEIVAARPSSFGGQAFVKRISALPCEQVNLDGCEWQLGNDEFFLLSDAKEHQFDSRVFGPVSREELIGPVSVRAWPWKTVKNSHKQEDQDG